MFNANINTASIIPNKVLTKTNVSSIAYGAYQKKITCIREGMPSANRSSDIGVSIKKTTTAIKALPLTNSILMLSLLHFGHIILYPSYFFLIDHINDMTHPANVHPKKKLSIKIASLLLWFSKRYKCRNKI